MEKINQIITNNAQLLTLVALAISEVLPFVRSAKAKGILQAVVNVISGVLKK
jgi:hypothetical protein